MSDPDFAPSPPSKLLVYGSTVRATTLLATIIPIRLNVASDQFAALVLLGYHKREVTSRLQDEVSRDRARVDVVVLHNAFDLPDQIGHRVFEAEGHHGAAWLVDVVRRIIFCGGEQWPTRCDGNQNRHGVGGLAFPAGAAEYA